MSNTVGNYFDCKSLGIANRLISSLAVTHHAGKLYSLGDPAAVLLAIQLDSQVHFSSIAAKRGSRRCSSLPQFIETDRQNDNPTYNRLLHVRADPEQIAAVR